MITNSTTKPGAHWLGVCVGGVLAGSAFFVPNGWLLSIIGLTISIFCLFAATSLRQTIGLGFVFATVKMLVVLSWYWDADAYYAYDVADTNLFTSVVGFAWVYSSVAVGVGFGIISGLVWFIKQRPLAWLLAPVILVCAEVIGSLTFAILTTSPEGEMNLWFSFGYSGYPLINQPLLSYVATGGGAYALTLFVYGISLGIYCLRHSRRLLLVSTATFLTFVVVGTYVVHHVEDRGGSTESVTVLSVNTQFKNLDRHSISRKVEESRQQVAALNSILQYNPDYILFPEAADATRIIGDAEAVLRHVEGKGESRPVIIDSDLQPFDANEMYIRSKIIDTENGLQGYRYKRHLTPNGEFVTAIGYFGLIALGYDEVASRLDKRLRFTPYTESQPEAPVGDWPGILFCSEGISPVGVMQSVFSENPPFVAFLVSHAWFTETSKLRHQLDMMMRTQIMMTGIPIVEAVNHGIGQAYDGQGRRLSGEVVYQTDSITVLKFQIPLARK